MKLKGGVSMADVCCTGNSQVMILSCSGGSNVGQLSNQAAIELTQEGIGRMYCLAGIGGKLSGFVASAKGAPVIVLIDGCEIGCGKKIMENAEIPFTNYIVITKLGITKNHDFLLKREEIDKVKQEVKEILHGKNPLDSYSIATASPCCQQ